MFQKNNHFIYLFFLFLIAVVIVTIQTVMLENMFTNCYGIFKGSFFHLIHFENIYALHPGEKEYFKYSPTFSMFFGLIAYLPDWLGLFILNLTNTLLVFFGVLRLPLNHNQKVFVLLFSLQEIVRTMQGSQTNGIYIGLLLMSFSWFESNMFFRAISAVMAVVFLKIFAVFYLILFFQYDHKIKFLLYSLAIGLGFLLLPLLLIDIPQLVYLYQEWYRLLMKDVNTYSLYSIKGLIDAWCHSNISGLLVLGFGLITAIVMSFVLKFNNPTDRLKFAMFLLIGSLLYRQSAENAGYVIAVVGSAVFFSMYLHDYRIMILAALYYFITVFIASDLYPKAMRFEFYETHKWRAIPTFFVWVTLFFQLISKGQFNLRRGGVSSEHA